MRVQGRLAIVAAFVLALPFSGCLDTIDEYDGFDPALYYKNPAVPEGAYRFGNGGSNVLLQGPYQALPPEVIYLTSELPHLPADGTPLSEVLIPIGLWRPANATEKVPLIIDAGPYYEQDEGCGTEQNTECGIADMQQTTSWLVKNFLPHGYAVAQVAVRGTGTAGGCMDLLGNAETHDLNQAIDYLATQEWANGNVAMIGASYDGSTQWSVAATGNPHLKAIVPTASLPDIFDLMFHNGSAETRGPIMHSLVYWGFGFDDDFPQRPKELPPEVPWVGPAPVVPHSANGRTMEQDLQNLCPEVAEGSLLGPYSTVSGDRLAAGSDYWTQRDHRQGVLDNYTGAVFLLHGLQDWNVDPHAVIPFNAQLRAAGIDVREWYGQWGHSFPDSTCAQSVPEWVTLPCRADFAETMLHWFNEHLKGIPAPHDIPRIQVQDSVGFWRFADSWPPAEAQWTDLHLRSDGVLGTGADGALRIQLDPPNGGTPAKVVELKSEPFAVDTRISGLPQLKLPFESAGGGELAAWLFDESPNGTVRSFAACAPGPTGCHPKAWLPYGELPLVGHASMNLRYFAGGEQAQALQPNARYVAQMEFEPLEVLIPAGHRVSLWVFQYAYPDHTNTGFSPTTPTTPSPVTIILDQDAVLRLPLVETDYTKVFPVPGAHTPTRDNLSLMYVLKPAFTTSTPQQAATQGPLAAVPSMPVAVPAVPPVCGRLGVVC